MQRPAFWFFPHRSRNSNDCAFILLPLYFFFSFRLLFRLFIKPSLFSFSSSFHPYFNFLMKPFEYFALSFPRHRLISILDFIYFLKKNLLHLPRFFRPQFSTFSSHRPHLRWFYLKNKRTNKKKSFQFFYFCSNCFAFSLGFLVLKMSSVCREGKNQELSEGNGERRAKTWAKNN